MITYQVLAEDGQDGIDGVAANQIGSVLLVALAQHRVS
jgi:hypothetical protein